MSSSSGLTLAKAMWSIKTAHGDTEGLALDVRWIALASSVDDEADNWK
ncbi:MAG: hypothetical protein ACLPTZ_23550 [Beijerinckiaceae bacterium]